MIRIVISLLLSLLAVPAGAAEALDYSPVVGKHYPTRVFWGDTHLHTNNSADAYTFANTTLTAEQAYRFARGEEIQSRFGLPVQLRDALDFLVVADHAEFLGVFRLLDAEDPAFLATRLGKYWHEEIGKGNRGVVLRDFVAALRGNPWDYAVEDKTYVSVWDEVTRLADQYYEPGRFTTYATLRSRWEPLLEVTQMKGDSESHPLLSPTDEFADFETWDRRNIDGSADKESWMLQYEYARSALKLGLEYQQDLGVNPFRFGLIGSTDSHTSLATADEDNFYGKFPTERPMPERATASNEPFYENWQLGASGYAAVWAEENTRESLFAAMQRREVYATTGPRMVLRFFAGWHYLPDEIYSPDFVATGYRQGVAMGGELSQAPAGQALCFMVAVARDPRGANLDRVQIIKGWLNDEGMAEEKIFNVAVAGADRIDAKDGRVAPIRNTVIVSEATYSNSVGAAELMAWWQDPEFDASRPAFYYARVLEIPTPRWTAYDAKYFGLSLPAEIPTWQQERAYSSPIWYTP